MIYEMPDMRYVDMCIYIDNTAYKENLTEEEQNTIFQYLYFVSYMLASKAKFFAKAEYYDDFAIYCATNVFLRLRNPKQFEYDEEGNPKLKRVKSVLNYIKKTIDPRRVDFQQQFYTQIYSNTSYEDVVYDCEYSFSDMLSDSIDELSMVEFNLCLGDIIKTARAFLSTIPYYTDKAMWNNIYTSVMLTFLNHVTLSNKDITRIKNLKFGLDNREHYLDNLYDQQTRDGTILYHLDENMKDYITVLTKELKHVIAKDLSLSLSQYIPGNSGMRMLIDSELTGGRGVEDN